jgi:hypothetical protein
LNPSGTMAKCRRISLREDTMKAISLRACLVALFVGAGALVAVPTVVDAQATKEKATPAAKEKAPAAKEKKPRKERTAKSKECSAEADKRGLKGKERRKFRRTCMRG